MMAILAYTLTYVVQYGAFGAYSLSPRGSAACLASAACRACYAAMMTLMRAANLIAPLIPPIQLLQALLSEDGVEYRLILAEFPRRQFALRRVLMTGLRLQLFGWLCCFCLIPLSDIASVTRVVRVCLPATACATM